MVYTHLPPPPNWVHAPPLLLTRVGHFGRWNMLCCYYGCDLRLPRWCEDFEGALLRLVVVCPHAMPPSSWGLVCCPPLFPRCFENVFGCGCCGGGTYSGRLGLRTIVTVSEINNYWRESLRHAARQGAPTLLVSCRPNGEPMPKALSLFSRASISRTSLSQKEKHRTTQEVKRFFNKGCFLLIYNATWSGYGLCMSNMHTTNTNMRTRKWSHL